MSEMDKAALKAAIIAGTKVAAEQTLSAMGYNTIAEDGWVVRIYENGERKKIKKIA